MDPQDHRRALPDGLDCSVCEGRVPRDRIRLLARRDGLAFVQTDCPACGSTTLGFLVRDEAERARTRLTERRDAAGPEAGDDPAADPGDVTPPITADDVLEMHHFLEAWDGDLVTLVGRDPRGGWRDR